MIGKSALKKHTHVTDAINEVAEEVYLVLDDCIKDRYFQEIVLLYSFIENLLKWLVFVKIMWDKSDRAINEKEWKRLQSHCKRLTFYNALSMALSIDLIDFGLYERIDAIREERNSLIHQFWIYSHRRNFRVLRKKLEKLARTANQLVGIFNRLTKEIGVDEVYEILL